MVSLRLSMLPWWEGLRRKEKTQVRETWMQLRALGCTHRRCIGRFSPLRRYVNVGAVLDLARLVCNPILVNGGAAVFLDKKHYNVYISQLISKSQYGSWTKAILITSLWLGSWTLTMLAPRPPGTRPVSFCPLAQCTL